MLRSRMSGHVSLGSEALKSQRLGDEVHEKYVILITEMAASVIDEDILKGRMMSGKAGQGASG